MIATENERLMSRLVQHAEEAGTLASRTMPLSLALAHVYDPGVGYAEISQPDLGRILRRSVETVRVQVKDLAREGAWIVEAPRSAGPVSTRFYPSPAILES